MVMFRPLFPAMAAASTSIPRHRFFVYAPDKTEQGTLARRLSVREEHLAGAKKGHESGIIRSYTKNMIVSLSG